MKRKVMTSTYSLLSSSLTICQYSIFHAGFIDLKPEQDKKVSALEKVYDSMKADALKYKTQLDEAIAANQELSRDLQATTQKAERMKKMHDDDAVCYHDARKKLKAVRDKVSAVLNLFLEDDSSSEVTPAEAEPSGFAGRVRSIPRKMMNYIRSFIHTGVVQAVTIIKSWNPSQNLDCLLEGVNPDV